nr:hypothetical protein Iba_chr07dCG8190 [Ipomoea batatas]GMD20409.1 hypothetical protein Iba_chr07fCG4580 [Ipomoea batatas]
MTGNGASSRLKEARQRGNWWRECDGFGRQSESVLGRSLLPLLPSPENEPELAVAAAIAGGGERNPLLNFLPGLSALIDSQSGFSISYRVALSRQLHGRRSPLIGSFPRGRGLDFVANSIYFPVILLDFYASVQSRPPCILSPRRLSLPLQSNSSTLPS